ncbi:hypothetical protein EDF71_107210 [Comamonas sp. JUb58]|nr:hypothetical protein EDF71_107210 [Comamonas sp. JUb58]
MNDATTASRRARQRGDKRDRWKEPQEQNSPANVRGNFLEK